MVHAVNRMFKLTRIHPHIVMYNVLLNYCLKTASKDFGLYVRKTAYIIN